jgi:antitoxin component YwqK of YwqJK toxin-antitoxin module/capsular polysaccharide biosynthesis protein
MILAGITVCFDFEDYLEETLPYNRPHFDSFTVVTHRSSARLRELCSAHHTRIVETDRFFEDDAPFNKGKATNEGLRHVELSGWVLHLDSDIVLPRGFRLELDNLQLDPETLFGCGRLLCPSYAAWKRYERSGLYCCGWEEEPPFRYWPTIRQFWGGEERKTPEGCLLPLGFFQLFSKDASCLQNGPCYPEGHSDAGSSDLEFALKWKKREFFEHLKVVHLPSAGGAIDANWEGRRTDPFHKVEARTIIVDSLAPALAKALPGWNGQFASCYSSGVKAEDGLFCCGLAHGLWSEWYTHGQLEAKGRYEKGVPFGRWLRYSAEGRLVAELQYRRGRLHGEFKVSYPSGQRKATGKYRVGRLDGIIEEWYPNGMRAVRGTYRSGRKHGRFLAWHQNGACALAATYRNDRPHGLYKVCYENGRPFVEGAYWHGSRHGWFVSWHKNGQKAAQAEFCNDRQIGDSAYWPSLDNSEVHLVPRRRYKWLEVVRNIPESAAQPPAVLRFVPAGQKRCRIHRATEPYVVRIPDAYIGFEGVPFDKKRLLVIDPIFRKSFELLCQTSRGFRVSKDGRRAQVPALIDIRWPANWSERPIHMHPRHKRTVQPDQPPFVQRFARLATIVHRCSASYYHWLMESLPRLLQIRDRLEADPVLALLVDYDFGGSFPNTWTDGYLQLLGVDLSRVVRYDPSRIYFAEELYLPGPVSAGRPQAKALQAIRGALLRNSDHDKSPLLVAVSRSNAACRRIINWEELVTAMGETAQMEVVNFNSDEWNVEDQIRLFSRASLIVGGHGAGLANMVFCDPGTAIIEIIPAKANPGRCFKLQAELLDLEHCYFEGSVSGLHDDFHLSVDDFLCFLKTRLRKVLRKSEPSRRFGTP